MEVRTTEGNILNIQVFCSMKPGLLFSTLRALEGLGLDVKQAVISCFNGFALDVLQAEVEVLKLLPYVHPHVHKIKPL